MEEEDVSSNSKKKGKPDWGFIGIVLFAIFLAFFFLDGFGVIHIFLSRPS